MYIYIICTYTHYKYIYIYMCVCVTHLETNTKKIVICGRKYGNGVEHLAKNDAEYGQNPSNVWGKHCGCKKWVKVGSVSPDSWARGQ